MSYIFEKEYGASADDDESTFDAVGQVDPQYHDYLATYVSLEELGSRRKRVVWIGVVAASVLAGGLGVAAYVFIGG